MLFSSFIGGCAEEATVRAQGDICKRRRSQLWREAHHAVTRSTAAPQHHLVYLHVKLIRKKNVSINFILYYNITIFAISLIKSISPDGAVVLRCYVCTLPIKDKNLLSLDYHHLPIHAEKFDTHTWV